MNAILRSLGRICVLTLIALLAAGKAFGQQGQVPDNTTSLTILILFAMVFYAYLALAVQTIARKTETPNDWFAWIPIANFFLLLAIAKKPLWWILLLLVPFANIVIIILIWMGIAENRGKPSWWGLVTLIPFVGFAVPGYLAWSE